MNNENTNYVNYLIELSQQGRKNAFFDLCEINLRTIFTLTFRITANYELAQETTLAAFREGLIRIKQYSYDESFAVWMMKIAVNNAIKALKEKDFVEKNIYEKRDKLEDIERLILNLPPLERTIFVLHDITGISIKEIMN